ncbi:hypothetical protein [Allorhodopirellula heiligendammensis]|uniref:Uncharacterized protein n=1 Tax=Allorhodopirellula heiligendammensis TaxID=2714739 RepID=A0A5C6BXW4_9BACT|nr:hypothetical protein [Allorhodopirellula heiligendammensis]TWU15664.1 hypothetical protein Poly21_28610 [Allorhodopirellula heiligendammensis]
MRQLIIFGQTFVLGVQDNTGELEQVFMLTGNSFSPMIEATAPLEHLAIRPLAKS